MPEFNKNTLEVLRGPLEDGTINISRVNASLTYPCNFMFVASMNPCPCGFFGSKEKECTCSPQAIQKYMGKISGPLLDRIDIQIEVTAVKYQKLETEEEIESSEKIKDISIIKNIYKDTDMKSLIRLAERITERSKAIVLFALVQDDKANMIFKSSVQVKDISMNDLLKDAISLIDGRGGGSHNQAQGGGKNNSNLKSAMEYAMMKINKQLK